MKQRVSLLMEENEQVWREGVEREFLESFVVEDLVPEEDRTEGVVSWLESVVEEGSREEGNSFVLNSWIHHQPGVFRLVEIEDTGQLTGGSDWDLFPNELNRVFFGLIG